MAKMQHLEQHLEKLIYFAKVAAAGSYSAAARELRLSQPALSRAVTTIEEALGVALFHRGRSGVRLTTAGRELLAATNSILTTLRQAVATIQNEAADAARQPLRLGTKEPFSIHVWPGFVAWARTRCTPDLTRSIDQASLSIDKLNSRLWTDLTNGKLDVTLMAEPASISSVETTLLFHSHMRLYQAGRNARQRFGANLPTAETALICYRDAIVKHDLSLGQCLAAAKLDRTTINVQSFDAAREMIVRGLGIGFLPHWIAAADIADERLAEASLSTISQSLRFPTSGIYLCAATSFAKTVAYRGFMRQLKTYCLAAF